MLNTTQPVDLMKGMRLSVGNHVFGELKFCIYHFKIMSCHVGLLKLNGERIRIGGDLGMVNSSEIRGGRKGLISILFAVIYYD